MKLLSVPQLLKGTRKIIAEKIYDLLNDWDLSNPVQFMCFDTIVSNTGLKSGACVLLKKKLERVLLKLDCRNHIFKIVVGKVFDYLIGPSNGPDIALFKQFSKSWPNINKEGFENGLMNTFLSPNFNVIKTDMVKFIFDQ